MNSVFELTSLHYCLKYSGANKVKDRFWSLDRLQASMPPHCATCWLFSRPKKPSQTTDLPARRRHHAIHAQIHHHLAVMIVAVPREDVAQVEPCHFPLR